MTVKDIVYEDFINYKKASMFIAMCWCDWKCLVEKGLDISICQNSQISNQSNIVVDIKTLIENYLNNQITNAIVFGGLEPLKQFNEVLSFIHTLRHDFNCNDDVVIYTGYYPYEIKYEIELLKQYKNIIMKFGRFEIDSDKRYDDVLGIWLNSSNQYAEKIS